MTRDPRIDPQPGDVVMQSQLFRHVAARPPGAVVFSSRCGREWFNTIFRESLADWQAAVAGWGVVHVAA